MNYTYLFHIFACHLQINEVEIADDLEGFFCGKGKFGQQTQFSEWNIIFLKYKEGRVGDQKL